MEEENNREDFDEDRQARQPFQTPLAQYGTSIVSLTNPENELYKLELTLRGSRLDDTGNPVKDAAGKEIQEPLLNEKGINSVMGTVQSIVNQVTVFGNLREREVNALRDFLADTLARDLMRNRVYYNIKSESARDKIFFSAISYAMATLSRGRDGDEKKFLSRAVHEMRTSVDSQSNSRGGGNLLSNILGWGKK